MRRQGVRDSISAHLRSKGSESDRITDPQYSLDQSTAGGAHQYANRWCPQACKRFERHGWRTHTTTTGTPSPFVESVSGRVQRRASRPAASAVSQRAAGLESVVRRPHLRRPLCDVLVADPSSHLQCKANPEPAPLALIPSSFL